MIRPRVFFGIALALSAIVCTFVNAQLTDEVKKKRDAREETRPAASSTPAETPEKAAKPKPADRKAKSKKQASPTPKPTATPAAKKSPAPEPDKSPATGSEEDEAPEPDKSPTPTAKPKSETKKSSEEDAATSPKPKQTKKKPGARKSPTPKPGAKKKPSAKKKSGARKKPGASKTPDVKEKPTPEPKRIEKAELAGSPAPSAPLKSTPEPARPPAVEPPARPRPAPTVSLPQAVLPSDITIEKSGLEKEQGFEPPPPPPPRRGFWPWSRQTANYRYLTSANIEAIRRAPVQRARWKFVIVHNSGTRQGNARAFDYYHRRVRRMRNGLAYHFVIGNGTSSRNGQIEIGDRWRRQINGGHVHSDYMNNIGLGICLVGDFNRDQPTRAQLESCDELIRYLRERCGSLVVRPHREVNPPRWSTDCPGDAFPYGWFGRFR
ncbi:MAG TPA: N-acetylmuramoyl-L-alanine amidase [Chthoniobacterales bacterium]|nr:N-acetylmuramoyl-L-alanine amidase [Chthoniobacterales bacterium]